jgi:hypothetical protein
MVKVGMLLVKYEVFCYAELLILVYGQCERLSLTEHLISCYHRFVITLLTSIFFFINFLFFFGKL